MREQQNLPTVRPGHIITEQATCPIPLGFGGLWFDGAAFLFRSPDGTDSVGSLEAAVQTTGAAGVTIATVPIPLGKTVLIETQAAGTKADASEGAAYIARAAFRNLAGVVSQIDSASDDYVAEDDDTWTGPDFVISGTGVLVQMVGKAATTINWSASIQTRAA